MLGALSGVAFLMAANDAVAADKQPRQAVARVAPIFHHGEGRGAYGCVVVNPPVFLTEEEARNVVVGEARKAGLRFAQDALTIHATDANAGDLLLDGYDEKHKIAFEIVSMSDTKRWLEGRVKFHMSVDFYDVRGVAQLMQTGLDAAKPNVHIGVFYDPMVSAKRRKTAQRLDERQLRQQVRDFIAWLKAQGVI